VKDLPRPDDHRGAHLADKYATHMFCVAVVLAGVLITAAFLIARSR